MMKHILLLVTTLFTLSLSAQYEKGNWYLNANSSLGSDPNSFYGSSEYDNIGGGRFMADRWLVGGNLSGSSTLFTDFSVEAYSRYYFPTKNVNLNFFAQLSAAIGSVGRSAVNITPAVGLEYQLAPGVLANASLGYEFGDSDNSLGFNLGLATVLSDRYSTAARSLRRGTFLLGGQVADLTLTRVASDKFSIFGSANFSLGYFLTDRFLISAAIDYGAGNIKLSRLTSETVTTYTDFSGSLSARYLLLKDKRFLPYVGAGIGYENYDISRVNGNGDVQNEFQEEITYGSLQGGLFYHLNDRTLIDLNLGINRPFSGATRTEFFVGLGLKVKLGQ